MFERFTQAAREVVVEAIAEAQRLGHDSVGPEHLLVALAGQPRGTAGAVLATAGLDQRRLRKVLIRRRPVAGGLGPDDGEALASIGVDLDAVRERVEANFGQGALSARPSRRRPRFSKDAKKTLELALRECIWMKGEPFSRGKLTITGIGTEHLLLGVLRGGGAACTLMTDLDVQPADLRAELLRTIADAA